jgi:hypothetical protein
MTIGEGWKDDDHRTQKLFSGTAIEVYVIAQLLQLPAYDVITEQI